MDAAQFVPVAVGVAGSLAALATAAVALRMLRSNRRKIGADAAAADAAAAAGYEVLAVRERARRSETELLVEQLTMKLAASEAEVDLLHRFAPALVKQLLFSAKDAEDVAWLLNHGGVLLWVISVPFTDGKRLGPNASILWASEAWAEELGRPTKEMCGTGWWDLLHPADRLKTAHAEAGAQYGRVRVGNRFLRGDGASYLCTDWRAIPYDQETGLTLAAALVVGREPVGSQNPEDRP